MTDTNTFEYYQARERRELELAKSATSPAISAIHRQMAIHYSALRRILLRHGPTISTTVPRFSAPLPVVNRDIPDARYRAG